MKESGLSTAAALRRLLQEADSLRQGLVLTVGLTAVGTALQLIVPIVVQRIIDNEILAAGGVDVSGSLVLGGVALGVMVLAALVRRRALFRLAAQSAAGLSEVRIRAFRRLHAMKTLHVEAERRGSLVARVTSDVTAIQDFVEWGGVGLLIGTAQLSLAMVAMLLYDWQIALVVLVGVSIYAAMLLWFQRILQRLHDRMRRAVGNTLGAISEAISGLPVIRAYGAERATYGRLVDVVDAELETEKKAFYVGSSLFASAELFAGTITAAVIVFGVQTGIARDVSAGTLLAMLFLVTLLVEPVQTLVETLESAQTAAAGVRRMVEVLDADVDIEDPVDPIPLPAGPLGLSFEGVSFRYPTGHDALRDVNVSISPGRRIAVVGETGSGKSTFVKLATRLLDARSGVVRLGGVPIDRVAFAELRRRVVYLPQEGFLFDTTIERNVLYGSLDATRDEVEGAFAQLELSDWLDGLPAGLDTQVGERGKSLSAGERQLVALARAWIAAPDVLVMDEATSAVDPALEVRLRRAMEHLTEGRTSVTVAHRLSTAEAADRVLVFDDGRLVEHGTHTELIINGAVYAGLHEDWMAGTQA